MKRHPASHWIGEFGMSTHVEGGSFAEVYRSALLLDKSVLPAAFEESRNLSSHIYFLLEQYQFSAFHRIRSDELWHFYEGDPLIVYEIRRDGHLVEHLLGREPGCTFFAVIEAGSWFASRPVEGAEYSLVGCTVAPGFDFDDFELATSDRLAITYPEHAGLIRQLCRD